MGPVKTQKVHLSATVIWATQAKKEKLAVQVSGFSFSILNNKILNTEGTAVIIVD